ncbi:MAG: SRPBCC domain-containing protein, partial [Devosiaceae bacterium]
PGTAFDIFTRDITTWWPLGVNSVSAMDGRVAQAVKLELKEGGSLTEIGHDGTVHNWGSVKVFKPGDHLRLAWHINAPESDATTVDVRFTPTPTGTQVELTHTGWEALGERAQDMRKGYDGGWVGVFEEAYAKAAQAQAA